MIVEQLVRPSTPSGSATVYDSMIDVATSSPTPSGNDRWLLETIDSQPAIAPPEASASAHIYDDVSASGPVRTYGPEVYPFEARPRGPEHGSGV